MSKNSQVQIGETIAVLFVFFILIITGFVFYVKVLKNDIESQKGELSQLVSVGIVERVMFLPEVQCSEDNVIKDNCIDTLKLKSASDIMSQNEIYYYDLLGYGNVSVSQIYPDKASWTIYSRSLDNVKSRFVTNIPVPLYDPIKRKYGFGILRVETLSR